MKLFDIKMQGHEPKHDDFGCPLLDHTVDVPDKKVIDRMLMRINQKIKHQAKALDTSVIASQKNDEDEEEKGKSQDRKATRTKKKGKKEKRPKQKKFENNH